MGSCRQAWIPARVDTGRHGPTARGHAVDGDGGTPAGSGRLPPVPPSPRHPPELHRTVFRGSTAVATGRLTPRLRPSGRCSRVPSARVAARRCSGRGRGRRHRRRRADRASRAEDHGGAQRPRPAADATGRRDHRPRPGAADDAGGHGPRSRSGPAAGRGCRPPRPAGRAARGRPRRRRHRGGGRDGARMPAPTRGDPGRRSGGVARGDAAATAPARLFPAPSGGPVLRARRHGVRRSGRLRLVSAARSGRVRGAAGTGNGRTWPGTAGG